MFMSSQHSDSDVLSVCERQLDVNIGLTDPNAASRPCIGRPPMLGPTLLGAVCNSYNAMSTYICTRSPIDQQQSVKWLEQRPLASVRCAKNIVGFEAPRAV